MIKHTYTALSGSGSQNPETRMTVSHVPSREWKSKENGLDYIKEKGPLSCFQEK